jgi:hypothetical protein
MTTLKMALDWLDGKGHKLTIKPFLEGYKEARAMLDRLKIVELRERRLARLIVALAVGIFATTGLLFGMGM